MIIRNRKQLLLCLFSILIALPGCSIYSLSNQAAYPVENWIYLHNQPKPGDYSIIANDQFLYRYEVKKTSNQNLVIEFSMIDRTDTALLNKLEDTLRFYTVNRSGYVLDTWVESKSSGKKVSGRIAKPGERSYMANQELVPIDPPLTKFIANQQIELQAININNSKQGQFGINTNMKVVSYINKDIPFGVVEKVWEIDGGALALIETIEKQMIRSAGLESFYTAVKQLRNMQDDSNRQRMTLLEYGRAK